MDEVGLMSMRDRAKALAPDVLLLVGAAGVSYGAWMIFQPLGFIVGGAFAIFAGVMAAKA